MPRLPWIVPAFLGGSLVVAIDAETAPADEFVRDVVPFLERHCTDCHGGEEPEWDLDLSGFDSAETARGATEVWRMVRDRVVHEEMPPSGFDLPTKEELAPVVAWIDATLASHAPASAPGHVTMRRLNRVEYENTIRDLVGVEFDARAWFPTDEVGHGFDNVGDALSMSDLFVEKAVEAAERIAEQAVAAADPTDSALRRLEPTDLKGERGHGARGNLFSMSTSGEASATVVLPRDGEYVLRARAFASQAGDGPARMALRIDGEDRWETAVPATRDAPDTYEVRLVVPGGSRRVGVAFLNDYYEPDHPDPARRDRNLYVQWLEVEGPLDAPPVTPFQRALFAAVPPEATPAGARRDVVRRLGEQAWRRPLADEEIERLVGLGRDGETLSRFARRALTALLASPHFLFRVELSPTDPTATHELDDFALATRLSYFLWSSMPDEELFALARNGTLHQDDVRHAQVTRMLLDARAGALVANFAGQWLKLRGLDAITPDPRAFPGFDDDLREAMAAETEMLFEAVLREDRDVRELVAAEFTFLNERLAAHYGIPGVQGMRMRRVPLSDRRRGGILGHASILALTSEPTRTSPVKRGKWILETLLDEPPPPPPPDVNALDTTSDARHGGSMRERMERHRSDPSCLPCHEVMDPLGFALENYDAVGAWRERDGAHAIDPSGVLPDGRTLAGPSALTAILASEDRFLASLVRHLAVYALGRGLEEADAPALDALLSSLDPDRPTMSAIIHGIVDLDAFRRQAGDAR